MNLKLNSLFGTNRLDKSPSDLRGGLADDSEGEDEGLSASDLLRQERDRD